MITPEDFIKEIPCDTCKYIEWPDKETGKTRCTYVIGFKIAYYYIKDGKRFTQIENAYLSSRKPFEIGEMVPIRMVPSYNKESSKNARLSLEIVG